MTAPLFSPMTLRGLTTSNRIVVSPMCQYSACDGSATDWHLMHYGQFAVSGAGLVIIEATHVEARGRITEGCLGLYSDENEAAIRQGGPLPGIQRSHATEAGNENERVLHRAKSVLFWLRD